MANIKRRIIHGLSDHPLYTVWEQMQRRCNSPCNAAYSNYGGRGIKVCKRWKDFRNFLADMGERPEGFTLDRVDVNGDYEPSNCRWADNITQSNNRTNNTKLTFNNKTQGISEWSRELGIKRSTLGMRITAYGWTVERALTT